MDIKNIDTSYCSNSVDIHINIIVANIINVNTSDNTNITNSDDTNIGYIKNITNNIGFSTNNVHVNYQILETNFPNPIHVPDHHVLVNHWEDANNFYSMFPMVNKLESSAVI
uniref:Uncharacterized protein n=1 Tax=Megaselia scalaris TaxID=36166 RepID=T1H4S2_MEGSC